MFTALLIKTKCTLSLQSFAELYLTMFAHQLVFSVGNCSDIIMSETVLALSETNVFNQRDMHCAEGQHHDCL